MRIGIDVGGTFTDGVVIQDHHLIYSSKVPTQEDISKSLDHIFKKVDHFLKNTQHIHISTTHGLNALLQGKDLYLSLINN